MKRMHLFMTPILTDRIAEFIENEDRSCSLDLTLSKPLTLDNLKANFSLYSLNRGFQVLNA